jgi:hypothetical protein
MAFMRAPYNNDGSGKAEDAKGKCRSKVLKLQGEPGFKVTQVAQVSKLKGKNKSKDDGRSVPHWRGGFARGFATALLNN